MATKRSTNGLCSLVADLIWEQNMRRTLICCVRDATHASFEQPCGDVINLPVRTTTPAKGPKEHLRRTTVILVR